MQELAQLAPILDLFVKDSWRNVFRVNASHATFVHHTREATEADLFDPERPQRSKETPLPLLALIRQERLAALCDQRPLLRRGELHHGQIVMQVRTIVPFTRKSG